MSITPTPLPDSVTAGDEIITMLQYEEGPRSNVYLDNGNPAIGYGVNLNLYMAQVIAAMDIPVGEQAAATATTLPLT